MAVSDPDPVFENLANFRQAGGRKLRNKHGQRIRDGLLFRSSRPDFVTPRDKRLFQLLGVRTIVDLRSHIEYQHANGEKLLDENYQLCTLRGGETVPISGGNSLANRSSHGRHFMLGLWTREMVSQSIQLAWDSVLQRTMIYFALTLLWICDKAFGSYHSPKFFVRFVVNRFSAMQQYVLTLEYSKPLIASILRHFLQPGSLPALINCSYGRDRTGVIVAVVLGCLEVEDDIIVGDYAKSEEGLSAVRERVYREMCQEYGFTESALRAPAERMRETLHEIQRRYGSVSGYLSSAGFTEEEQDRLKEIFLAREDVS